MNRDEILSYLTMLDFNLVEFQLYLDTHPEDTEAIAKYNETADEAAAVRMTYERAFGPVCSFRSESNKELFTWINSPWPWENSFNFCINKEGR